MVIDPMTMMALANAAKGAGGGSKQSAPQPFNAMTPQMLDYARQQQFAYQNRQNAASRTPAYGAGGVTTQQGGQLGSKEIKVREYAKFLVENKGYTQQNAQSRAQQVASSSKEKFKDDKEFNRFVRGGGSASLSKKKGKKIRAKTEYQPAGFDVSSDSEMMRQGMNSLGLQSLGAASGLPYGYAAEEQRALQARQGLAGQAQNMLSQGPGASGLFATQETALENLKNKYLNDFGGVYQDSMRSATSDLIGSGFNSSSLANEYMKDNAYDTQSDFLTDALAKLAGQEQSFLSQASGMGTQNLNNVLNSFSTLGQNQGIGSVLGGIMNPAGAGLFTDPQSTGLAADLQQRYLTGQRQDQSMMNQINLTPTTIMPESPGFFSSMATKLSPFAGGFLQNQLNKPKTSSSAAVSGVNGQPYKSNPQGTPYLL